MTDGTKFILFLLLSSSSLCFGSDLDIQCLRSLKQSVIDSNGVLNSSWDFDNLDRPSSVGSICRFTGVDCWHPDENRVLSLRLGNLGLEGPFPKGLQDCTSMSGLDLSDSKFSGPIPYDIAQQMPYLTYLDLSNNSFTGEIPQSITNLAYLNVLKLQHNQLSGQIPERFNMLSRLTTFSVVDNFLSGPIPTFAHVFSSLYFTGNRGLCGAPLDECPRSRKWRLIPIRLRRINEESSIGAAVGFVLGFVVAFYFHLFCSKRLLPCVFRA
ncbi:probably inactive leucine-rich repeat receptor-like protein kinase At5g48380 [Triticum dicoccoides]|uniref:probably inactive leucine-rich repeat receptor-like protein kinase At5g48380 n=1 Tax=Triticum dicoccoides TaxID=85692 RepID=UPI0018908BF9|nr:probably inactive leucine-rich repeat receptor-like protein kinase At5g48380 [Triticum dicoccoides]